MSADHGKTRRWSVVEIMVITFTFVVAVSIAAMGLMWSYITITSPETDTSGLSRSLVAIITLIVGYLLGMLTQKSDAISHLSERPGEEQP